jgi:hypothetical protein
VCAMPMLCPLEAEDFSATRLRPSAFSPSEAYLVTCEERRVQVVAGRERESGEFQRMIQKYKRGRTIIIVYSRGRAGLQKHK